METKSILQRIARLAKLQHRDMHGQLMAMVELYEKTHGVSGAITRKRKKKQEQPAVEAAPEVRKKRKPNSRPRSDIGVPRSEEARKNIRLGQRKARLRKMFTSAQASA